ncbi:DUF6009 family protein [Streptomyces sp. NPDC057743]|uniref:DUF6009 family protein n=1 Tax=Streptomyces sp. NPDC057743 TaxID=3346236 RepID=UPI00367E0E94
MLNDPDVLKQEDGIVWTEEVEGFDYVRETLVTDAATRRRPIPWRGPGRRVGYSVLKADARSGDGPGMFTRRIFWVKEYDRSEYAQGKGPYKTGTPSEGVDPRTVKPGVWGEQTSRAWGAPLPSQHTVGDKPWAIGAVGRNNSPEPANPSRQRAGEDGSSPAAHTKLTLADWLDGASVPDTLRAGISEAFSEWLRSHSEEVKHAIGEAVAERILPSGLRRPGGTA